MAPSRDAELRAAIVADPDDDAARAVYADWLLGLGDPRGELILVQRELERLAMEDPRWPALAIREAALLRGLGDAGLRDGAPDPVKAWLRGGFIDELTAPPSRFADGVGELLDRHPITGIELELETLAATEALVESGALRRIRRLSITSKRELAPHLDVIARSSKLPALTALRVVTSRDTDLEPLIGTPLAARLHALLAYIDGEGDELIAGLAGRLPAVRSLGLRNARLGADGARALAAAHWPALRGLDLQYTRLDPAAVPILATSLPALEALAIRLPAPITDSLPLLLAAPAQRGLRELVLAGNGVEDDGPIDPRGSFPALERLTVGGAGANRMLAARDAWPRLRDLATNVRDVKRLRVLTGALAVPLVRFTAAIDPALRGRFGAIIAGAPGLRGASELVLRGVGDLDVQRLTTVPWPALRSLQLRGELGAVGLGALAAADLPSLGRLDIDVDIGRGKPGLDRPSLAEVRSLLITRFGGWRDLRAHRPSWWPWTE